LPLLIAIACRRSRIESSMSRMWVAWLNTAMRLRYGPLHRCLPRQPMNHRLVLLCAAHTTERTSVAGAQSDVTYRVFGESIALGHCLSMLASCTGLSNYLQSFGYLACLRSRFKNCVTQASASDSVDRKSSCSFRRLVLAQPSLCSRDKVDE
jgi:hypothetical protein